MNNESERQNQIDKIERFNLWKFEETKNNQIIFPIFSNNNKKRTTFVTNCQSGEYTYVEQYYYYCYYYYYNTTQLIHQRISDVSVIRRESSSHLGVTFLLSFSFQWKKKNNNNNIFFFFHSHSTFFRHHDIFYFLFKLK